MSLFNRLCRTPMTLSTYPNYSDMGHELNYRSVSLHTQDFLEMKELLKDFVDVLETSNPQKPVVNQH